MKQLFKIADNKRIEHLVTELDLAEFETGLVHPFYSTFALGRDAEWASRQFVLDMLDSDEEGIGTYLTIQHQSPALLGEKVTITATIVGLEKNNVNCTYEAKVGDRVVAVGTTGQKILKKEKVQNLISGIRSGGKKEN